MADQIFKALLQYGYQMKGLVKNNSKKVNDVTLNSIWRHIQVNGLDIFNALLQYGYHLKDLL
jgi:hypothetical protein